MAPPLQIKIMEQCRIFPSPNSLPQISLPLTIFDLPWLPFSPTQSIFFFQTTSTSTSLPLLKHSLSLTLHHFYPLAARLSATSITPHLTYSPGDSIPFTAAESTADFNHLSGYHPRSAADFHSLIPQISSSTTFPLFLVQVTIFPQMGFSIGVSFSHLLGDQRTFNHLMKTWAFICNSLKNSHPFHSFNPSIQYDRNVIKNPIQLHTLLLQQCHNWLTSNKISHSKNMEEKMVRATFLVTLEDMENIKKWIIDQCKNKNQSQPLVLSPYVLTCSFIWVCLIKSELKESVSKNPIFFGFNAGALTRLDYHVPNGYFGNCVGFGRSAVAECELAGEDGLVAAAEAIGRTIKELDGDILGGADKWEVFLGSGRHLMIVGSPKVDLYKMEFGWGRPIKVEEISIDGLSKGICLSESRDCVGGIEVGLVLPRDKMDDFTILFKSGLKFFS